jgi:hypothetical protein
MKTEEAIREALKKLAGEDAAFAFDVALTIGISCELCDSPGGVLRYPDAVVLCDFCFTPKETS